MHRNLLMWILGYLPLGFAQESVDLDEDGREDVRLVREEGPRFYPGGQSGYAYAGVLITAPGVDLVPSDVGPDAALDFSSLPPATAGTNRLTFEYTEQLPFSPWVTGFGFQGPRYVGLRIVANGATRYGWLLLVPDETISLFNPNYGFHRIARHGLAAAGTTGVRTPSPRIRIRPASPGKVRCEWDSVFLGPTLETAATVNAVQWTPVANSAAGVAELDVGSGARFFRVR